MNRKNCRELFERLRRSPKSARFSELCQLCECAGLTLDRQKGSHKLYQRKENPRVAIPLQESGGGAAKPYQVRQVLALIEEHDLLELENEDVG